MSERLRGRPETQAQDQSLSSDTKTRLPERSAGPSEPSTTTRLPQTAGERSGPSSRLPNAPDEPQKESQLVSLDTLVGQVRHLHALPMVVLQVVRMTGEGTASAQEIAKVIQADYSFAARILKLANSAHYGLPRNVGRISDAVVLIGMRSIRSYAIAASTQEPMKTALEGYELGEGELWRHSLGCAMAAQMLAEAMGYPEPEEAFVAGLLHDIGKISLDPHIKRLTPALRNAMEAGDLSFAEAERLVLGYDHAEVGGRIAQKWYLPQRLAQAIALHHEPMQNGQVVPLAALAHIGNAICQSTGVGLGVDGMRSRLSEETMSAMNVQEAQMEKVLDRLVNEFQQMQILFGAPRVAMPQRESEQSEAA